MSFIDQRFPAQYAYGAVASDDWLTEIVTTINNRERRNAPFADPRRSWDLSTTGRTHAERDGLHKWFLAMRGPFHSFAFKDFADHFSERQQIGVGDGTQVAFQIMKRYTVGTETYSRKITKPVLSSVRVWVNGVLQSSGYSVARLTGVVTFSGAPANGAVVECECEFDVPVRFQQSRMSWQAINRNAREGLIYVCSDISLIEVIGE